MKTINKKGIELSNAFGAVLAVILIAVLVIVAIFLFDNLSSGGLPVTQATVTNERGVDLNLSIGVYTVTNATVCNFQNFAVVTATNGTDGAVIATGNYTVNSTAGTVVNATDINYDNATLNYTYDWGREACTASETMVTQFATYPALVGLVGTIVFLGIVIGVLVGSFVFGGRRRI